MAAPTIIDVPHRLGRDEARRRLRDRIGELPAHIPGGIADVATSWPSQDRMALKIAAMGQTLDATIDIEDRLIRVSVVLPLMLSFLSGMISAAVKAKGSELLLGDESPKS